MSIATTTGDRGHTSLIGGRRVSKGALRVEAIGTVDELIAAIAVARGLSAPHGVCALARSIQRRLFTVSEALADERDPPKAIDRAWINELTAQVHEIEQQDGILIDWAVPGDDAGGAAFDLARTVCRRAERAAVRLVDAGESLDLSVLAYLNRLADLLWLFGRSVERDAGADSALRQSGDRGPRWSKAWP